MSLRVTVLGLLTGAAVLALVSCGERAAAPAAGSRKEAPPRSVRVTRAQTRAMERTVTATGSLAAQERSVLSAKVPGRLEQLAVDVGSEVRKGDLLAQIEPRDYELAVQEATAAVGQARTALGLPAEGTDDQVQVEQVSSVKQAKAVLEEATRNRERVQALAKSGIASTAELDTVQSTYTVALTKCDTALEEARSRVAMLAQRRAEYELARKQLTDASVRAPFDGTVQSRPSNLGEYIGTGTPIVELVKTDPLRLRLEVPERDCSLVRAGQTVRLSIEGDTNCYSGTIKRLSPALDEQTRTLRVEADVPRQGSLRAGLFARALIVVNDNEEALTVPTETLVTFAGLEKVIVVQGGKAVEKVVSTGRRGASWTELTGGLQGNEDVVLNPVGLRTGQGVTVEPGESVQARRETR